VSVPDQNNSFRKEGTTHGTEGTTDSTERKDIGLLPVPNTAAPDVDARVALIQALIPVALDPCAES